MSLSGTAGRLMIIVDEDAQFGHRPIYLEIVKRARDAGMAGASVFRGIEGFGRSHQIHTSRILDMTQSLPMMIVIVDTRAKIETLLPRLAELMSSGIIALDDVEIVSAGPPGS